PGPARHRPGLLSAMRVLRQVRSLTAFVALVLQYVLGGLYQRLLVWPHVLLRPRRHDEIVGGYMRGMSHVTNVIAQAGGARLRRSGRLPTAAPLLVLANHQSLLDITNIGVLCHPYAPWFVTRSRYARFVPAVSLCLRLMRGPIIDPRDRVEAVRILKKAAREQAHGILIFPEGHRSKDGRVQEFKAAGVLTLLRENRTPVYLAVTDGMWRCRRILDFIFNMHLIDGSTDVLGPFQPPADEEALADFIQALRQQMVDHIEALRSARVD
ncbi:MAG: lysophospholipid acyltransferase family protein, partial [bacterium]